MSNAFEKLLIDENGHIQSRSLYREEISKIVSDYLLKSIMAEELKVDIELNKNNYKEHILDPEIRSLFAFAYTDNDNEFDLSFRFLFLVPIFDQGYNFGQYRLCSHLIRMGYSVQNIKLFPVRVQDNVYVFDQSELEKAIDEFVPTFVCETGYLGWERQLIEINHLIKAKCDAKILLGGPLTSSHTPFAIESMQCDVVFVGHGEYLLEEYLRAATTQRRWDPDLCIDSVYYHKKRDGIYSAYVNQHIELLNWDMQILAEFCKYSETINLFSSDVCYGNCVFCYRRDRMEQCYISADKLLLQIMTIVKHSDLLGCKYIRFYDDDFFAASPKRLECIEAIADIIKPNIQLYELQFSLRSLLGIGIGKCINILQRLNLSRVTIGIDGFNDDDLKRLQKGYSFKRVFEVMTALSSSGIPSLLYAILTTHETTCSNLYESFMNMLKLILLGNIFIGPNITPVISLHSNNDKLYPKFKTDKFIYLEVNSVSAPLIPCRTPQEILMQANILPIDRLVRQFITQTNAISQMESAYVLPLVSRFFVILAHEMNWIRLSLSNVDSMIAILNEKQRVLQEEARENVLMNYLDYKETMRFINKKSQIYRDLSDIQNQLELVGNTSRLSEHANMIEGIITDYIEFYKRHSRCKDEIDIDSDLPCSIKRLLAVPILFFVEALDHRSNLEQLFQDIVASDVYMDDEEERMFESVCV